MMGGRYSSLPDSMWRGAYNSSFARVSAILQQGELAVDGGRVLRAGPLCSLAEDPQRVTELATHIAVHDCGVWSPEGCCCRC